ncbi:MAG: MFS transporter [Planctomycetota bacterium]|jgi:dipeptide/tripeptide permease
MEQPPEEKGLLASFPRTYWVVIVMEFFERTAFYGMMAFLADYFVQNVGSTEQWGFMRTCTFVLLYLIPIFSGALAEKMGYKKVLGVAFLLMVVAYWGVGNFISFPVFFSFMILLAVSGGLFKPVISGTIARSTNARNSTLGFGIYYWSINVGSFIASLVAAHFVKLQETSPGEGELFPGRGHLYTMFLLSTVYVALMFINNLLFYKEPSKPGKIKTFKDSINGIITVCTNWRFLLLLLIFSGFWAMYNRSQDSALWLLRENYLDMTPVNEFVTSIFASFGSDYQFTFNVAHIMTINAGVIILLQVVVSYLTRNTPPLPTMIVGIGMASLFPLLVTVSNDPWLFVLGLVIFSIGEITAYPKLISYVGLIAPRDKVAIYMGFVFLPIFFAALIFDIPNGIAWDRLVIQAGEIKTYWAIVAGLGILTLLALLAFHFLFGRKLALTEKSDQTEDEGDNA